MIFEEGETVRVRPGDDVLPAGAAGTVTLVRNGQLFVEWHNPANPIRSGAWLAERFEPESAYEARKAESGTTPHPEPESDSEAPQGDCRGRVYVSGPMTGLPGSNFPAFDAAADELRAQGYEVENPADKGIVEGWTWEDYLRYDLAKITECSAIYTLPGWRQSKGALLEMHVAKALGVEWLNPDEEPEANASGEVRTVSSTGGEKGVKPARFDLIPAHPLWVVAEHYGRGAQKYEDRNWERGYEWSKSFGAMMRHAWAFWGGEDNDPETGSPHMAAVVFHALALIEFATTHREFDNRPTTDTV